MAIFTVTRDEVITRYAVDKQNIKNAGVRFAWFQVFLSRKKDRDCLALLSDLLEKARKYVNATWCFERDLTIAKHKYGGDDIAAFQQVVSSGDFAKRTSHNSLISLLEAFNRNVSQKYGWDTAGGKIPVGGIFTLSPDALRDPESLPLRAIIADWAFYLVISQEK